MCSECGFITYPDKIENKDIKKYYQDDYRKCPSINNFFTGERKIHYHAAFLNDLFKDLKDKEINFLEIGSAFGLVCNWVQKKFPKWKVYGTELTKTFKRVALHDFKLNLTDDFDSSLKYDLIMTYKVGEHQIDFDKELLRYRECLNDNGHLYISVPTWLYKMSNFGLGGFDIEYYYHTDHINVWTRKIFEGILSKCGFKIVKQDHDIYDDTYLCVKSGFGLPNSESTDSVLKRLDGIKKSSDAYLLGDYKSAIEIWPRFPAAWQTHYEHKRNIMHQEGFPFIESNFIVPCLKMNDRDPDCLLICADVYKRYEKHEKALELLEEYLAKKPNAPAGLLKLGEILRIMGKFKESSDIMNFVSNISHQTKFEAINWYYYDISQIPTPFEREN